MNLNPHQMHIQESHASPRQQMAEYWLNLGDQEIEAALNGDRWRIQQKLLGNNTRHEASNSEEMLLISRLEKKVCENPRSLRFFLAAMLYFYPHELPEECWFLPIDSRLSGDFIKFMLQPPVFFRERGEIDQYRDYLHRRFVQLNKILMRADDQLLNSIAKNIMIYMAAYPLYFSACDNLKDFYKIRTNILRRCLKLLGYPPFTIARSSKAKLETTDKIRFGIIAESFLPRAETYALLPVFEHLSRTEFEVTLYSERFQGTPLERYCVENADRFVLLPRVLKEEADLIRSENLDVLLFGNNITAMAFSITLLALQRLAKIQIASINSPVTSGMDTIDYYVAGKYLLPPQDPQAHYQEQLMTMDGSGMCWSFPLPDHQPTIRLSRPVIGHSMIFISGANFFKIIPEIQETWARILSRVSDALLLLYPFNPNWADRYTAADAFIEKIQEVFERHGVEKSRLKFVNALPEISDVLELLKIADVYLDSYPYGGATSLLDPLRVGLPVVVKEGDALRFRQASGLLKDLGILELITDSEEGYIELAVMLASQPILRQEFRCRILNAMQNNPPFLDSRGYSRKIAEMIRGMVARDCVASFPLPALTQPRPAVDSAPSVP